MARTNISTSKFRGRALRKDQRGITLITTLMLLLLMTAMALTMVLSVSSDMLINGYYRNFRGAFYAADSGLNIVRQDMVNQVVAAVPATFGATVAPIPVGTDAAVQTYMTTTYGSSTKLNLGQGAKSWPESYKITSATLSLAANPPQPTTDKDVNGNITAYHYVYNYTLTAVGQSQGSEAATLIDSGSLIVNATLVPAGGTKTSFAGWGMFIDQWAICSGGILVPGTITGPTFTNGAWTFGTTGSYIFTDAVGSHSANAGYQFTAKCDQVAASSDKLGSQTIKPTFQAGFNLAQPSVPLPPNDYSQQRAVLDSKGTDTSPVTKNDLNNSLRDINKAPYPNSGATSGVFLPYTVDSSGNAAFNGGGIYVEGSASVTLSTSGASAQVYTITQGTTTTVVTIDNLAGTTTVASGGNTLTINGVPTQKDSTTGSITRDATMLYVNGSITSLSGPGQGQTALQDTTALTITAASNVTITGDILYKTEPVTTTQNQIIAGSSPPCCAGTPADTLIPGNDHGQVLGIYTATGDIQLKNSQSNSNLEIDASIATISQGGTGGLVNVGKAINTLTIVGGRIQNNIKSINSTTRNVYFDRRFALNGFAPPWFPSTTITGGALDSAVLTTSIQRVQWVNKTSY